MSETNDAHVTRWRHASRGIAVLNADCWSERLGCGIALVRSIQMMPAEIVDPASSGDPQIDDARNANVAFHERSYSIV